VSIEPLREVKTFVLVVSGVMAALFVVGQMWRLPWSEALDALLFSLVITISFTVVARALELALAGRHASPARVLGAAGLAVLVGGELGVQVAAGLWGEAPESFRVEVFSMGSIVMGVVVLLDLFRDRAELAVQVARLRTIEMELALLRARIRPHFLFNSLNSLASLIADEPRTAERAVEDLSVLLRHVLEASDTDDVALADELEGVRAYLALQQLRYEERLTWDLDSTVDDRTRVPALVLQPLVENAVIHAVAPQTRPVQVCVSVRATGDDVELVVSDNGTGAASRGGTGTALRDLRRRLALLEPAGTLEAGPLAGGGFRATVRLPSTVEDGS
jgi:anti-sigma regulatory factor (Ser/Thr protein kinase)